ncbi:hypothetical protein FNV43_RR18975 [Rhamnella rubrinervis]|uniref:Uncharacterized protein n=1 Tax=Rhamnella rubrinervis TaxID=2594499 RepID=A0A8K0E0B4_9ROSA|nr:hypothetical protein FNV43_RR18975 [Rhamnella rubrinervis]
MHFACENRTPVAHLSQPQNPSEVPPLAIKSPHPPAPPSLSPPPTAISGIADELAAFRMAAAYSSLDLSSGTTHMSSACGTCSDGESYAGSDGTVVRPGFDDQLGVPTCRHG